MKCLRNPPHKIAKLNSCGSCQTQRRRQEDSNYKKKDNQHIHVRHMYRIKNEPGFLKQCQAKDRFRKYNLIPEQYDEVFAAQNGKCAICGRIDSGRKTSKDLEVDHNSETKIVRGLLCHNCNTGIGHFKHDAGLLDKAAVYLRKELN